MDSTTPSSTSEPAGSASNNKRKAKTFQCRFCPDTFNRLEHIQRHERTHTKEKPFPCACGKAFARRDLLLRHEKLVHDIVSERNTRRSRNSVAASAASPVTHSNQTAMGHSELSSMWPSHNQNGFVSGSPHQNPVGNSHQSPVSRPDFFAGQAGQQQHHNISSIPPTYVDEHDFVMSGTVDIPGDYNLFFDNFDVSNFYLPATVYDSDLPISLWSRPNPGVFPEQQQHIRENSSTSQNGNDALSQFGSRLPSLRPEEQNLMESEPSPQADFLRAGPPWKISGQDHRAIQNKLKDFENILPADFELPSRHTLSRYFEGYITGFNQHLPFLHIPSFSVSKFVPELILAIGAVGAQYRFESSKGNKLWYAAKAVANEQIRRRQSEQVASILSSPKMRSASLGTSPASHGSPVYHNTPSYNSAQRAEATEALNDIRTPSGQARLGTIQTLLIMMAMGMWGPPPLLREATSVQNQLALLLREHGLHSPPTTALTWEDWILIEGDCRTKCIAYCFFNLHSIAYDNAPILRTSELKTNLPHSAEEWRASSSEEWLTARRKTSQGPLSFHTILSKLFSPTPEKEHIPPISSLGNYVLIHAIIQQIYLTRHSVLSLLPTGSLPPSHLSTLDRVLRTWQITWETAPESSLDPTNPYGPVAFSSTALLRLAYIRLHCDLGPCRGLDTRDPYVIAENMRRCPELERREGMSRAVLQAAHALSIPVKIGIRYVAHTHTLLWSMQHSLANLECAFLLSRWLSLLSTSPHPLTVDESNLLQMVRSIVGETHFAIPSSPSSPNPHNAQSLATTNPSLEIKKLSVAVVRIWAEVFTGSHHVFPLVKVIGLALERYAELCESEEGLGD